MVYRILFTAILLFCASAFAQSSETPIEITADTSLEWNRTAKTFTARDNALAKQGDSSISAALLTAHYREKTEGGGMDIYQMNADTNVIIRTRETNAFGEKAVYNLDTGLAVMTGNNLRLVSPDQTLTAKEKFEYFVNEGKMIATGNALIERPKPQGGKDTLKADTVTATFKNNQKGERVLDTMEARGNVVITTPLEKVTGAYGIYRADTNTAELTGGVTISRGPNELKGERATVNMNTSVSQLFGGAASNAGDGRVRGTFYPGSTKEGQ